MSIKNYICKNVGINCETQEEADLLSKLLHYEGYTWSTGHSYLTNNTWNTYKENTIYYPYNGYYSHSEVAEKNQYDVIIFKNIYSRCKYYVSNIIIKNIINAKI